MAAVGAPQDVPRWPFPRSVSARTANPGQEHPHPHPQSLPQPPQQSQDHGASALLGTGSRGESVPLVAWPEEGTDSTSLMAHLLQPRKSAHSPGQGPPEWATTDGPIGPRGDSGGSLTSRLHADSRLSVGAGGSTGGGADAWRAPARPGSETAGSQGYDSGADSTAAGGGPASPAGSTATERRRRPVSLSAHHLQLRPDWHRSDDQWPRPPSPRRGSGETSPAAASVVGGVDAVQLTPTLTSPTVLILPRRARGMGAAMGSPSGSVPGSPLSNGRSVQHDRTMGRSHLLGASGAEASSPSSAPSPHAPGTATPELPRGDHIGSPGMSGPEPSGRTLARRGSSLKRGADANSASGVDHSGSPYSDVRPLAARSVLGDSSVVAVASRLARQGGGESAQLASRGSLTSTCSAAAALNSTAELRSQAVVSGRRAGDGQGDWGRGGGDAGGRSRRWAELEGKPDVQQQLEQEQEHQPQGFPRQPHPHLHPQQPPPPQPHKAAAPRHPPVLRVAIGLLPSPTQPPSSVDPREAGTGTGPCPSPAGTATSSAAGAAAPPPPATASPAAAAAQLLQGTGSRRSVELPSAGLALSSASQSPSPPPPPVPPLLGLPSFLGSPVVLDPHPIHVHPAGPGAPAPGPGALPSGLSRSTSGADRSLSASASLAALLAVPPTPSRSPSQAGLGSGYPDASSAPNSFRNRQQQQHQHSAAQQLQQYGGGVVAGAAGGGGAGLPASSGSAASSRRSANGRSGNGYHRSGSYFRVREAVPEAVLDSLPGMQAARGLPPQPQHPGAVPDEWPPQPPPLLSSLSAASAALSCPIVQGASSGGMRSYSGGGGGGTSIRRYGTDSASGIALAGQSSRYGMGRTVAPSNGSSPQSTMSGGMGAAASGGDGTRPGSYSHQTSSYGSWLRREEAMPPPDMLPIQPSMPPLAMDHVQAPSAFLVAAPTAIVGSEAGGPGVGAAGTARRPLDGLSCDVLDNEGRGEAEAWAELPAAAAMAAAAAASPTSSMSLAHVPDGPREPSSDGLLHIPMSGAFADGGGASAASGAVAAASPPPPPPPRHTFRSQSKLRLMHLGGLGGGGGGDGRDEGSSSVAAVEEQEALLALLGSTRMLSSVLTATNGPSRASDPAIHGVKDPRYDHSAHFAVIPEHTVTLVGADGGAVTAAADDGGGAGGGGVLLGNTRMGSTVFSPPVPGVARLAASLRRAARGRPRAATATRAAMPDLELLSRHVGCGSVVGPDGRPVSLATAAAKASAPNDTQLELPPPEELVSAVNGHKLPLLATTTRRRLLHGSAGQAWQSNSLSPRAGQGPGSASLSPLTGSSDESEDPAHRGGGAAAMRPYKPRDVPCTRDSGSGNSLFGRYSNNDGFGIGGGGGGGSNGRVVPALIRHLSAPARRLTLTSNSGLPAAAPPPAVAAMAAAAVGGARGPHGHAVGHGLVRKPSLIAAGLRLLKRAFTLGPSAPHSSSSSSPQLRGDVMPSAAWHAHGVAGGADDDGDSRRTPDSVSTASQRYTPDAQHLSRGALAGSSGVGAGDSRRRLQASQRSFLKHSAVLGWVQPSPGPEDDPSGDAATAGGGGGADSEGDGESTPMSRTATSNSVARLHSLQSLLASGGGHLTCDAVIAFSAGDGGGGDADGGVAAAVARRRHAAARVTYPRRSGGAAAVLASDDASEDIRLSGSGMDSAVLFTRASQDGTAPAAAGAAASAWTLSSSAIGPDAAASPAAAAQRASSGAEPPDGGAHGRAAVPISPAVQRTASSGAISSVAVTAGGAGAGMPLSPSSTASGDAGGHPTSPHSPHQPLLTRLGSKLLGRTSKWRGRPVVPLLEGETDAELYGGGADGPYSIAKTWDQGAGGASGGAQPTRVSGTHDGGLVEVRSGSGPRPASRSGSDSGLGLVC